MFWSKIAVQQRDPEPVPVIDPAIFAERFYGITGGSGIFSVLPIRSPWKSGFAAQSHSLFPGASGKFFLLYHADRGISTSMHGSGDKVFCDRTPANVFRHRDSLLSSLLKR